VDAFFLPTAQETHENLASLATTDGKAEGFGGGLDVEEAGEPGLGDAEVGRVSEFGRVESVVEVALGGFVAVGSG